jgi:hypothetical protein
VSDTPSPTAVLAAAATLTMFDVHSSLCLARATVCKYTIKIIFTFSLQVRRNVKLVVFNVF